MTTEQYETTRKQKELFAQALAEMVSQPCPTNRDPRLHQAMTEALQSQLDDLCAQLTGYHPEQKENV